MHLKKTIYCLVENFIFNTAIFFVFFMHNPLRENFINMNIHPLLIVVALMALRYGNYLGVISAAIATATFVYAYYLLGRDLILFVIDFSYYKFILMFFLTAFILGQFRDRSDSKIHDLTTELDHVKENYDELLETEKKSRIISEELKKQVIGAEKSILSLYEIATSLETTSPEAVYTETMGLLARFLDVKTASIYIVDKHQQYLRLKLRMGEFAAMSNSIKVVDFNHFQKIIHDKETVKMDVTSKEKVPLLSAPVIKEQKVIAIINIEEIDFEILTEYSYNLFKIIVDWISKALVRAIELEGVLGENYFLENTRIMDMESFNKRLLEEKKRLQEYGLKYALLSLRKGTYTIADFYKKISKSIRDVDAIGYNQEENIIHILLPATPAEMVPKVEERILAAFDYKLEQINPLILEKTYALRNYT